MEDPEPLDPVALAADIRHRHCPVPEVEEGVGVFQHASLGEYDCVSDSLVPDDSSPSSFHSSRTPARTCYGLRIYYQNVRGLRTKIDSLFLAVTEADYDVIVLTETWLDDRIYSTQLFGTLYTVFRADRSILNSQRSRGGGVLIAVSTKLNAFVDPAPISDTLEQLWIMVKVMNHVISIGVIYLPPDRKHDTALISEHVNSLGSVCNRLSLDTPAFLFGDYNQSTLHWNFPVNDIPYIDPLQSYMSAACCALLDGFSLFNMAQINTETNHSDRLLDLVLANESAVSNATVLPPAESLTGIDPYHPPLEVTLMLPEPIAYESSSTDFELDFRRADYDALNVSLSGIDWQFIESTSRTDDAVDFFCHVVDEAISSVVPERRPPQKPPWSNSRLRELKRQRSKMLRKFCNYRSTFNKRLFNIASDRYRKYNLYLYNRHVKNLQENLRRNPKQFWSFVNGKRRENGLPSSMILEDSVANNEREKCNLFAHHFQQVFNRYSATAIQVNEAVDGVPRDAFDFCIPYITPAMVLNAVQKLKLSFSAGPNGIPSSVLIRCANVLKYPLAMLFNLSVQQSVFPTRWKFSYLFPVYKKGDKRIISNYRGITSLCACSKLFEIIVNDALFASCKNHIDIEQHGFFAKRSVATNLLQFVSQCLRSMDSGLQVDAVYMDLKAAFDRVDHGILLGKLQKLGVSTACTAWFKSYLSDRCVRVKIGSSHSDAFSNVSGVPQGSNLGPLLFSLYINDVSLLLPPGCRLFYADDTKLFYVIRCLLDCLRLQEMLDVFVEWCAKNLLTLSIEKCNVISFYRKNVPISFDYNITGRCLQRIQHVKDLGVTLDNGLTFRVHYDDVIAKANRQLGFIFKIANEFRDPLCLKSLYCSLVRSILETSVVVWCPYHANWIARIEAVQRKFVRYALRFLQWHDPLNLPPYEGRCRLLNLEPLEHRRTVCQAVFAAKLLAGEIDCPSILADLNLYAPERRLRQRDFLFLEQRYREYGLNEPIRALCQRFNEFFERFDFNTPTHIFRRQLMDLFRNARNLN